MERLFEREEAPVPLCSVSASVCMLERDAALERLDHTQKEEDHRPFDGKAPYREDDEHLIRYVCPQEGYQYRLCIVRHVIQQAQDLELLFAFLHTPFTQQITRNGVKAVITEDVLRSPSPQLDELLKFDLVSIISLKDSGNADLSDCYHV